MVRKRKSKKHPSAVSPTQKRRQRKKTKDNFEEKVSHILDAIAVQDVSRIKQLGRQPGGFLTNSLRRKIWPLLLECPEWNRHTKKYYEKHKDEQQVSLDVPRSLSTYPKGLTDKRKKKLQEQLNHVIIQVLRKYPKLHYYQGFHDICTVFLLLYGNQDTAAQLVSHVALFYIRYPFFKFSTFYAMLETLEPILRELTLLDTLLYLQDPELGLFLQETGVLPYYCLSWVITWFSHDLDDVQAILQLFDTFLSSTPMMPLYTSAALVLMHRNDILAGFSSDDPSAIHSYLSKLPQQKNLNIDMVIGLAMELENKWDPFLVQKQADVALDQVSVINTYQQLVSDQKSIDQRIMEAYDIVSSSPLERHPIDLAMISQPKNSNNNLMPKMLRMTTYSHWGVLLISAIGIGATAIFINQSQWNLSSVIH